LVETAGELRDLATNIIQGVTQSRYNSWRLATGKDNGFYLAIVFKSSEQRAAFVAALKLEETLIPEDPCVADGARVAQKLGLALPPAPALVEPAPNQKWAALAMEPAE
jgi:hypothetical protein